MGKSWSARRSRTQLAHSQAGSFICEADISVHIDIQISRYSDMGQQESSYRKFDDRVRRRRRENSGKKEARKEQEKEEEVTPTSSSIMVEKEKVKGGGHFSLANLRWRPGLVVGTSSEGPGWFHGWCNKAQVRPGFKYFRKLKIFYHQHTTLISKLLN